MVDLKGEHTFRFLLWLSFFLVRKLISFYIHEMFEITILTTICQYVTFLKIQFPNWTWSKFKIITFVFFTRTSIAKSQKSHQPFCFPESLVHTWILQPGHRPRILIYGYRVGANNLHNTFLYVFGYPYTTCVACDFIFKSEWNFNKISRKISYHLIELK